MPQDHKQRKKDEGGANGSDTLPPGWVARTDGGGRTYYLNTVLKTTQWERPVQRAHSTGGVGGSVRVIDTPIANLRRGSTSSIHASPAVGTPSTSAAALPTPVTHVPALNPGSVTISAYDVKASNAAQGGSTKNNPTAAPQPPAPAHAGTVPNHRAPKHAMTSIDDQAYFHTDDWPFEMEQHDREKEKLLGRDQQVLVGKTDVPQLNRNSCKLIDLMDPLASSLQNLDIECALKHLDAVKGSMISHDDLHGFTFMEGEYSVDTLDLAGLENAPGLFDDISQRCRLVFTNKKRLIFTQATHSAEVGMPKMHCLASLLSCFHDQWSTRKWSSFCASINASEILQVFVQQTLVTSYKTSNCSFNDPCPMLWCTVGGTMYSEKDIDGTTQTLGDHDPGGCLSRWDKTRSMRHALVIRYVDCSTNTVMQTTAMAHPDTQAAQLYEMARSIEANITVRTADWLKCKLLPTPLAAGAFKNSSPSRPLVKRKSYMVLLFVLFVVALFFFLVSIIAAIFMIIAVVVALLGSFSSSRTRKTVGGMGSSAQNSFPTILVGTQGGGGSIYVIAALAAIYT